MATAPYEEITVSDVPGKWMKLINVKIIYDGKGYAGSVALSYEFLEYSKMGLISDTISRLVSEMNVPAPEEYMNQVHKRLTLMFLAGIKAGLPDFCKKSQLVEVTLKPNVVDVEPYEQSVEAMSEKLPGVMSLADSPCRCFSRPATLHRIIIHLNDFHEWSRENIADWIDELHDAGKINAEF